MKHAMLCVLAVAAWGFPAAGDVVSIEPSKDNSLYEFNPDIFEPPLSNGKGSYLFAGMTNFGYRRRALLHFDVAAAVPAGSVIVSVTLRLNVSQTRTGPAQFPIYRVLADWGEGRADAEGNEGQGAPADEGSVTWLHRFHPGDAWSVPGGDLAVFPGAELLADTGPCEVSGGGLSSDAQVWLDNPAQNFGWCILGPEGEPGTAKRFGSRDNPDAEHRPLLTIEFTPPALGCVGDYNQDGGVDGADVEAFFADWEEGDPAADLNEDGGVDGADVEFFFTAWESGC